ncbi:MAG: 5-(carboxyamino)imidazole ribonucleotide mutase [Candidatus Saccharibacteria bacterium]|nr:5-(carboxyamino)imidazole ribonucleotide mutase [Candidatus Saccharibacteria bacterium]
MATGEQLRVGIIMGSDSDLKVMRHAGRALRTLGMEYGIHYEDRVISAHRTPHLMAEYAATAAERGLRLIIAGAGGSAALPGMVASETALPVLGVSITDNPDVMNRALGSMIGMPEGKPLAVFQGPAGAFNAGLFAGRVLMATDPGMRAAYEAYELNELLSPVLGKDVSLRELGAEAYLNQPPATT